MLFTNVFSRAERATEGQRYVVISSTSYLNTDQTIREHDLSLQFRIRYFINLNFSIDIQAIKEFQCLYVFWVQLSYGSFELDQN